MFSGIFAFARSVEADLHAWYGESQVLHGIDFQVGEGELVTLLGRNGAGKTTTLKSIMGMVGRRKGSNRPAMRPPSAGKKTMAE